MLFPFESYESLRINLAKDADYDAEFVVWIAISCAYIEATRAFGEEMSDPSERDKAFTYLLYLSLEEDA